MIIRQMNYDEFINRPDIKKEFDNVFNLKKEQFKQHIFDKGLDKEHLELFSNKVALLETDFYFTDLHEMETKKAG
jgi:hypothetical protein